MAYNKKNVLEANTEAIRVVFRLEKERREATEAEKDILRNYQGFGGLKCVLNRCDSPDDLRYWSQSEQQLFEPTQRLKQMIYREAVDANTAKRYWESIKTSVLTSFYTDTRIVAAISDALTSVDVPIRRCLDPSAGMGAFTEILLKGLEWSMQWKKICSLPVSHNPFILMGKVISLSAKNPLKPSGSWKISTSTTL